MTYQQHNAAVTTALGAMVITALAGSSFYYCSAAAAVETTTMVSVADVDANLKHILLQSKGTVHETVLFSLI